MSAKKSIVVLVSPPGGGKSTLARKLARDYGYFIVDLDAIVTMLHGDYALYNERYDPIYKQIECDMVEAILKSGGTAIIDRCNNKRSTRQVWVQMGRKHKARTIALVIATSSVKAMKLSRQREDKGVSTKDCGEVIDCRIKEMEPLDTSEGFDSVDMLGSRENAIEARMIWPGTSFKPRA
jgi:predicted kinase